MRHTRRVLFRAGSAIALLAACAAGQTGSPAVDPVESRSGWSRVLTDVGSNVHADDLVLDAGTLGLPGAWSVRKDTARGGRQDGVDGIVVDTGELRLGWRSPSAQIVRPRSFTLDFAVVRGADAIAAEVRGIDSIAAGRPTDVIRRAPEIEDR